MGVQLLQVWSDIPGIPLKNAQPTTLKKFLWLTVVLISKKGGGDSFITADPFFTNWLVVFKGLVLLLSVSARVEENTNWEHWKEEVFA